MFSKSFGLKASFHTREPSPRIWHLGLLQRSDPADRLDVLRSTVRHEPPWPRAANLWRNSHFDHLKSLRWTAPSTHDQTASVCRRPPKIVWRNAPLDHLKSLRWTAPSAHDQTAVLCHRLHITMAQSSGAVTSSYVPATAFRSSPCLVPSCHLSACIVCAVARAPPRADRPALTSVALPGR